MCIQTLYHIMAKKDLASQGGNVVPVTTKDVEARMIQLRGQYVLLDRDVAALYGVQTKEINQAVKNNPKKFPARYLMEVDKFEKQELVKSFDRFEPLKHSTVAPTAFTEGGLYMLATILKSEQAVETTLAIIDTFTMVRQLSRTMEALQNVTDGGEQQQTLLEKTGRILADMVGQNLTTSSSETEIELNFAVVKIKHKVIKGGSRE